MTTKTKKTTKRTGGRLSDGRRREMQYLLTDARTAIQNEILKYVTTQANARADEIRAARKATPETNPEIAAVDAQIEEADQNMKNLREQLREAEARASDLRNKHHTLVREALGELSREATYSVFDRSSTGWYSPGTALHKTAYAQVLAANPKLEATYKAVGRAAKSAEIAINTAITAIEAREAYEKFVALPFDEFSGCLPPLWTNVEGIEDLTKG